MWGYHDAGLVKSTAAASASVKVAISKEASREIHFNIICQARVIEAKVFKW